MVYAVNKGNEMIDRKDLRVGLVTGAGGTVVAMGDTFLLYKYSSGSDGCVSIDYFCEHFTERKEKEIVEVELVVSSEGHTYFVDIQNRAMPNFNIKIEAIRTGIKKQYNKATGEFVKERE